MNTKLGQILGWMTGLIIVASIIGGYLVIGGPTQARDKKQDNARLQAMQATAITISCYRDNMGTLPENLMDINQEFETPASNITRSKRCKNLQWRADPVSGEEFEYIRKGDREFQICAHFARASTPGNNAGIKRYSVPTYSYRNVLLDTNKPRPKAGRHCYTAKDWEKD